MNLRAVLIALAVIAALLMIGQAAFADPLLCRPKDEALSDFAQRYGETPQALGRTASGEVLVITANNDTGTWTAWRSPEPGTMCPVSSGDHWMVKQVGEGS